MILLHTSSDINDQGEHLDLDLEHLLIHEVSDQKDEAPELTKHKNIRTKYYNDTVTVTVINQPHYSTQS